MDQELRNWMNFKSFIWILEWINIVFLFFFSWKQICLASDNLILHVYRMNEDGPGTEELDDEEDMAAAHHWLLPASDFSGLWESLVYDEDIKRGVSL